MEDKQLKNIIISFIILAICSLGIVCALHIDRFKLNGKSNNLSNWNVELINIKEIAKSETAKTLEKSIKNTLGTFNVELVSPGDFIEYELEVKNTGTLKAYLDNITRNINTNEAIIFTTSGLKKGDELNPGDSKKINVTITYAESLTSKPRDTNEELEIELNFKEKK